MNPSFEPSFRHFHNDIERYLKSEGKCEKNEHGQTVFHGYYEAFPEMFRAYIDENALAPLVEEFRKWNWEWHYDDHLLELTLALQQARDWPLLKELWAAVVASAEPTTTRPRRLRRPFPKRSRKSW